MLLVLRVNKGVGQVTVITIQKLAKEWKEVNGYESLMHRFWRRRLYPFPELDVPGKSALAWSAMRLVFP